MSEQQLEMNLNPVSGNQFRDILGSGSFVTLIETTVPPDEMDRAAGEQKLLALEKTVLEASGLNTAIAIIDSGSSRNWSAVEYASLLPENSRDKHLVYLSGAGMDQKAVGELLQMARNAGLRNIVPVTGTVPEKYRSVKECRKIPFTESLHILQELERSAGFFFAGTTITPYQYTPYSLLGTYYKLLKKLSCNAEFIVTQLGWDMLKLQSLSWYLTGQELFYPKIARLALLSPEDVEQIISGNQPGIKISPEFRKMLTWELKYSRDSFEAAQYRRLELQAAGCKLLGYSGIQIYGADSPAKAELVLGRIRKALNEFASFEEWLEEYNSFMASAEIPPYNYDFNFFDRILHRDYPSDQIPVMGNLPPPAVSFREKTAYCIKKFLFPHAGKQRPESGKLLKTILAGCRGCGSCRLAERNFICVENCPMHLANGPCGAITMEGKCPYSKQECIHHKILRIAHWKNALPEQGASILPAGTQKNT